ncbi:MAG: efflux transporter outer membrane subunit [Burkholderiaceae bacterium]|nr:efflux transporter outer membrane subunit [Burkholderiaceae bacterium]
MNPLTLSSFRQTRARIVSASLLTALAALAGCAAIPSDREVLPQRDLAGAQLSADIKLAQTNSQSGWPQAQWWTQYGDAQLNQLVEQALRNSPTLQSAAAHIETARAAVQQSRSEAGATVDLNAAATRTLYSADGLYPPPIGGAWYTETTAMVSARYDFDWWGKHKAAIGAAVGEVNARNAEYAQTQQTLAAAVVQTYFSLQDAWGHLDNLHKMENLQQALIQDKAKRIAHGLASSDAEHGAENDYANLRQLDAFLTTQATRQREALRALLGADAQALADLAPRPLPDTPAALPAKLGMELLARRPDLQAAHWRVEAALERTEAAKAAFYPDINLSGFVGSDVISLDQLFRYGSRTMAIGPAFSLPLFDSGRLQANLAATRARRNEMIADYNQSVCNAVRDVAQAAVNVQGMQSQLVEQQSNVRATAAILNSTQARMERGLADNSALLAAELAVGRQQDLRLELRSQLLQADVTLIKALGGGYRSSGAANPQDAVAAKTAGITQ